MSARYQRLAAAIVADILSGRLAMGSRTPSARELAKMTAPDGAPWGRATAERAMRALAEGGWTSPAVGSGTYVADQLPAGPPVSEGERLAAVEAAAAGLIGDVAALKAWRAEHERVHGHGHGGMLG
jgi:DNA-binding GntR family transcriptional regulator